MTALPRNPDVIVVGAGVAGLAAAKALQNSGSEVIVLEAAGHIGGRCVTDTSTFSQPFDRGGSWLHSAPANPLARRAEARGTILHKKPFEWSHVQVSGYDLGPDELAAYSDYHEDIWAAINTKGAARVDTTTRTCVPDGPWADTAAHGIAQMLGGDADVTSARDVHNYDHHKGDWLVGGGLGAFVRDLHNDVPVRPNCAVQIIDTTGPSIKVTTPDGVLEAEHLILTVSTAVLASGVIRFIPALPPDKHDAIEALPLGLLNKVGIEFDPDWKDVAEGQMADYHPSADAFCALLFGFCGSPLSVGFVAGCFADALEQDGPGAATDFCLEGLQSIFGTQAKKHVRRTDETAWRSDALALGAYSYAKPGGAFARKVLARPIEDRLFFAGEATMTHRYATVHGAYESGQSAAAQIIARQARQSVRSAG